MYWCDFDRGSNAEVEISISGPLQSRRMGQCLGQSLKTSQERRDLRLVALMPLPPETFKYLASIFVKLVMDHDGVAGSFLALGLDLEDMVLVLLSFRKIRLVRCKEVCHCSVSNLVWCVENPFHFLICFEVAVVDELGSYLAFLKRHISMLDCSQNPVVSPPKSPEPSVEDGSLSWKQS